MASTNTQKNRRRFWFDAQHGVCHLRCTDGCRAADGRMEFDESQRPRSASWDHLSPRNGRKQRNNLRHPLLLACKECNVARGNAPLLADDPRFSRAGAILAAWRADVERRTAKSKARAA